MPTSPWLSRATAMKDELVAIRRDIHCHPELAFQEQRTAEKGRHGSSGLIWTRYPPLGSCSLRVAGVGYPGVRGEELYLSAGDEVLVPAHVHRQWRNETQAPMLLRVTFNAVVSEAHEG